MKSLDANETHVIWSADLAPRLRIMPGDTIEVETSLGSGARYLQSATPDDIREVTAISPGLSLTGHFVEGAEPGDVPASNSVRLASRLGATRPLHQDSAC